MTCIVGLVENGVIYMGGDSAACDSSSLQIIREPKVFKKDGFLFGVSGNPRMSDILRYNFDIPRKDINESILGYMHQYFIPELKECLSENGILIKQDGVTSSDAWVMIGFEKRLFILESHFHLSESSLNYNAVGSGMDAALGCLYGMEAALGTLYKTETIICSEWILRAKPEERLTVALRASERFNYNVRGPFTIISNR